MAPEQHTCLGFHVPEAVMLARLTKSKRWRKALDAKMHVLVWQTTRFKREIDFFIDNLLVRIHFIVEMIWWTDLTL